MADEGWGRQVALTFGNTKLTAHPRKPHELEKNQIGRMVYDQLSKTLAESAGPSLARTIYDALSLKPGLLGISLDLKLLLEGVFPTLKKRLNDLRLSKVDFTRLQMFVETGGTALWVPITEAKCALGERLFDRMIDSSILGTADAGKSVRVHDLVAQIIYAYRNAS